MFFSPWRRWLKDRSRLAEGTSRKRRPARLRSQLRVEPLEDRLVPAVHTWTGASTSGTHWSDAANWAGGAPAAGESNVVLNFGAPGALRIDARSDFPVG